ncbi:methionyl-tRNA formyltransferase [Streptomyces sp. SL13]|uniref:Methionyl-tRNA formyltransferase n=1 Tax=Streptantibioticus silvisoli TaxID=2705255 RepID=A0AA90HC46_9ACTN|nr:methionyl-tRNA formyltransferase [Streptantibioticus silvisoli]MDI5964713.1 methionyl-tRNA formyltransferase [Streptantibioticus silvisoli]MDI5972187.1 methionyl-tRNA formyltransferase [Streptantibioticus silvisoli]
MRLVFAGTPEVAVPALDALLAAGRHEVVAVVTRPDAPAGRGRRLAASPVAQRAEEAGIEVLKPKRPREEDFLARLREIAPDCCPVVAYGALLPKAALDIPVHGWVNLHFSLLPAWRGAAPVQHAVIAGDEVTGASTFLIEEGLDSGPVYGVLTEAVGPRDTSGALLERLAGSGAGLLTATMDGIADGTLVAREQPADGVSLAPKIAVEDARVDWTAPALRVDRLIRGCTPAPGAWTLHHGERLKLAPVRPAPGFDGPAPAPGELVVGKNSVHVGTGSHPVELTDVQAQGKKLMRAADWARGVRLASGDRLGE